MNTSRIKLLSSILAATLTAQSVLAGSPEVQAEAEYLSTPVECSVMEVAIQRTSGDHEAEFHCIESATEAAGLDGRIYELKGLPVEFRESYQRNMEVIRDRLKAVLPEMNATGGLHSRALTRKARQLMRTKLRASNIYRSSETITFTEGSSWSISEETADIEAAVAEASGAGEIAAISATEESTVLVLHITAVDSQTSASPSELSDAVFGTYGDPVNLASQYDACSYGKKTFVPAEGTEIVDGVAQINIGISVSGATSTAVMNAATAAANDLLGSLSGQFDHVMYALPPGTEEGWIAFGYFNYYPTVYNDNWATKVSAQMHEIGHNLYLQHSNEGGASYDDQQGMMGYSYNQDDGPVMCFNAAKSSQLTWYSDKELNIDRPWSGKVIGLADYDQASSEQNVILKIEGNNGNPLYLTYNRKAGINSGTREAANLVTIVRGADRQTSDLLAKLGGGQSHAIPDFWNPGNDLIITVDEIGTDFNSVQYALVSIQGDEIAPVYELTVANGSGDGDYEAGDIVTITASAAPPGQVFEQWNINSGNAAIANSSASTTTLTMPSNDVTVTASFKNIPLPSYTLTVNSGSGDGSYPGGVIVHIDADAAPTGQVFDQWTVNAGNAVIANDNEASTTLVMPQNTATITASYRELPPESYQLTVSSGSGDGLYLAGETVSIQADTPPSGEEFHQWVVSAGEAEIADNTAATTTITMGDASTVVTAEFREKPPAEPAAEQGVVTGISSSSWTTVYLNESYSSMVVIATPNYTEGSEPAVTRIRKASGSSFQVKLAVASSGSVENIAVHYIVVEEGVYDLPRMEARKITSDGTNGKGNWNRSSMEEYAYAQAYSSPVVLGQVMTHGDPGFSVFWASKGKRKGAPSARACYVGKHVAEDPDASRGTEELGVIVIEAGSGTIDDIPYTAGRGPKTVSGIHNSPAYSYSTDALHGATAAVLSSAGMRGRDGGWPILYGTNPAATGALNLAVDEDSLKDKERRHGVEKVAYMVLGSR